MLYLRGAHLTLKKCPKMTKNGDFSCLKNDVSFAIFPKKFWKSSWIYELWVEIFKNNCNQISSMRSSSGVMIYWKWTFFKKAWKKYNFWGLLKQTKTNQQCSLSYIVRVLRFDKVSSPSKCFWTMQMLKTDKN